MVCVGDSAWVRVGVMLGVELMEVVIVGVRVELGL